MPAEVFYYISKNNKSSACAACLMLACGSCAVLKLKYKLHGRGDENGTAYTAIFLTVAREENITRASEVLHITQPTLSRQMKQLEQELGTELFVRGRNFALTEAGMLLRRRAEEVVDMMYKIESEIETAGEVGGVISIGSGALKSSQFLPEVMSAFQKLHPKVRFEIYSNSSQYIKERMDRGLLDFGIMLEPIDIEQYEYIRLEQKERWGLLMRRGHPLAEQESVTCADLLSVPLITPARLYVQKEISN